MKAGGKGKKKVAKKGPTPKPNGTEKVNKVPTNSKTVTENETWDPKAKRTYAPLLGGVYFRPDNVLM